MAEAAGLALGVVSLALSVCKGIITYASAVHGKTSACASLDQKAKALARTLDVVCQTLNRLETSATGKQKKANIPALEAIAASVQSCETDLLELDKFLEKYSIVSSTPAGRPVATCRKVYKFLKFGFHEGDIGKIESRLTNVNSTLIVGLETLNIDLSSKMIDQLESIQHESTVVANKLDDQTQAMCSFTGSSDESLRKLDDLHDTVQQLEQSLHDIILSSASDIHARIDYSTEGIIEAVNSRATGIEELAVANQTMVLTEVALFREALEAHTATIASLSSGLQHLNLNDQRTAMARRLISKPSFQRDAMISTQRLQHAKTELTAAISDTESTILTPCTCRGYSRSRFWKSRSWFGQLAFSQREAFRHGPQCSLSMFNIQKSAKRSSKAQYRAQNAVIGLAFQITFTWYNGSGGFGISPYLSFQTVVDPCTSPSFRLLACIEQFLYSPEIEHLSGVESTQLAQSAMQKLQSVFSARRASPLDRDQYGETLLHEFAWLCSFRAGSADTHHVRKAVVWQLIHTFGISATLEANNGFTPLTKFFQFPFGGASSAALGAELAELLLAGPDEADIEMPCLGPNHIQSLTSMPTVWNTLLQRHTMDPLSEAILRNQPDKAVYLLRCDTRILNEMPSFSLPSHLHLAAVIGQCFDELLAELQSQGKDGNEYAQTQLKRLFEPSSYRESLVYHILDSCAWQAVPDSLTQCPQSATLARALEAGLCMQPRQIAPYGYPCLDCFEVYIKELVNRRQQLGDLARRYLPREQTVALGLHDRSLLDRHTDEVISRLQSHGVSVPSYLVTTNDKVRKTIWQVLGSADWMRPLQASKLLSLGFTDLEVAEPNQHSFLEELVRRRRWRSDKLMTEVLKTTDWVLEHSHDQTTALARRCVLRNEQCSEMCIICTHSNASQDITIGHMIADMLGETLRYTSFDVYNQSRDWPCLGVWRRLTTKVLSQHINCESPCLCSTQGLTPFSWMLASFFVRKYIDSTTSWITWQLWFFVTACGDVLRASHYRALLRLLTFEALSLEHSCRGTDDESLAEDDLHSAGPPEVVAFFHDIVDELDEMMEKDVESLSEGCIQQVEANHDRCIDHSREAHVPAADSPGDDQYGQDDISIPRDMVERWIEAWERRSEEALESIELESAASSGMQYPEDIGVIWHTLPPPDDQESQYEYGSKEYWLWTMEKIWPDPEP